MKIKKRALVAIAGAVICIALIICYFAGIWPFSFAPKLELNGQNNVTVYLGDTYKDPGAVAEDYRGNDISDKIKTTAKNINLPGEHKIKYSVTDHNKTITVARTVNVKYKKPDKSDPTYGQGIAVLMYHHVYNPDDPPSHTDANYISTEILSQHLKFLVDNDYYFPTWNEIRRYVDGEIDLPRKSVVLTFDDCSTPFIENGIPLLEKYPVKATSFVIVSRNGAEMTKKNLKHVTLQSHSYNMHRSGGNIGHGGVFTALSYDEALLDLNKSVKILETNDAFAYPFGDYNDRCKKIVKDAGFKLAFTTEYGKVKPGEDPLLLPRVRVNGKTSVNAFAKML